MGLVKITFLGAAREVTGSCYLVQAAGRAFLVDHGMFQGGAGADRRNRAPLQFDPRAIEFVDTLPRTETGKLQRFRLRQLESDRARDTGANG